MIGYLKRVWRAIAHRLRPMSEVENAYWNWHDGVPEDLLTPIEEGKK